MPDCIREIFMRDLVKNSTRLKQCNTHVHLSAPSRTHARVPSISVQVRGKIHVGDHGRGLRAIFKRRTIHRFARSATQRHSDARSKSPINASALPRFIFRPRLSIKQSASMYRICLSRSYNYRAIYLYTVPLLFTPRGKHNRHFYLCIHMSRPARVSRAHMRPCMRQRDYRLIFIFSLYLARAILFRRYLCRARQVCVPQVERQWRHRDHDVDDVMHFQPDRRCRKRTIYGFVVVSCYLPVRTFVRSLRACVPFFRILIRGSIWRPFRRKRRASSV